MSKAILLSVFLFIGWSGVSHAEAACDGLKRKECTKSADCRWQKAKKACVEKKAKKSANVKKKSKTKAETKPAQEAPTDDSGTESEDVDMSLDEF